MGGTSFEPKESVICPDGCNFCQCEDGDNWNSSVMGCSLLKPAEVCEGPEENADSTSVIYRVDDALAVQLADACFRPDEFDMRRPILRLCYSDNFEQSDPAQARLWIVEEASEGECLRRFDASVVFDVSPIRKQYTEANPSAPRGLVLKVGKDSNVYEF